MVDECNEFYKQDEMPRHLSHDKLLFAVLPLFLRAGKRHHSSQSHEQLTNLLMNANKVCLLVLTTAEMLNNNLHNISLHCAF